MEANSSLVCETDDISRQNGQLHVTDVAYCILRVITTFFEKGCNETMPCAVTICFASACRQASNMLHGDSKGTPPFDEPKTRKIGKILQKVVAKVRKFFVISLQENMC